MVSPALASRRLTSRVVAPLGRTALALGVSAAMALPVPSHAQLRDRPEASTIAFRNELPPRYELEAVRISVDGYVWADGPVAKVAPGTHEVTVAAQYRASSRSLEVRSTGHVRTEPGKVVIARAVEVKGRAEILWP